MIAMNDRQDAVSDPASAHRSSRMFDPGDGFHWPPLAFRLAGGRSAGVLRQTALKHGLACPRNSKACGSERQSFARDGVREMTDVTCQIRRKDKTVQYAGRPYAMPEYLLPA